MDVERLIRDLSRPEAFLPIHGRRPSTVSTDQTHISVLFFTPGEVFKVKKALDLGFLDFRDLEARRRFCAREVDLNHELAPGVYLGVTPVTLDAAGRARFGGDGPAVEYAVRMKRLPADRMLATLLAGDRAAVTPTMMEDLARTVARFHSRAPRHPEAGTPRKVREMVTGNVEECRSHVGSTLSEALFAFLLLYAEGTAREEEPLFAERVRRGRILDGHGDLHSEHVCFAEPLVIYDRLEFSDELRRTDLAAEVAFLAMDLDHRGRRDLSAQWLRLYAERLGETLPGPVLDYYLFHRACVRGKVLSIKAGDEEEVAPAEREGARRSASAYFALAAGYALRREGPFLAVCCGPIASGKSTLAGRLADRLGVEWLRSDVERKAMFGIRPERRTPADRVPAVYSPQADRRTYSRLEVLAQRALGQGRSALLDATYHRAADREDVRELARRLGVPVVFLFLDAPREVLAARLREREERSDGISDARSGLLASHLESFERPEAGESGMVSLDASRPEEELFEAALDALLPARKSGPSPTPGGRRASC